MYVQYLKITLKQIFSFQNWLLVNVFYFGQNDGFLKFRYYLPKRVYYRETIPFTIKPLKGVKKTFIATKMAITQSIFTVHTCYTYH